MSSRALRPTLLVQLLIFAAAVYAALAAARNRHRVAAAAVADQRRELARAVAAKRAAAQIRRDVDRLCAAFERMRTHATRRRPQRAAPVPDVSMAATAIASFASTSSSLSFSIAPANVTVL